MKDPGSLVVAGSLALAGCLHEHVVLSAPAANITAHQRVLTFTNLRPVTNTKLEIVDCLFPDDCTIAESIHLANKLEIVDPGDLLPVVKPDSETARAIAAFEHDRTMSEGFVIGSAASILAGAVYLLANVHTSGESGISIGTFDKGVGLGLVVAGFLSGFVAQGFNSEASTHRSAAFVSYRRDLAERLAVCVSGYAVVPCEASQLPSALPIR